MKKQYLKAMVGMWLVAMLAGCGFMLRQPPHYAFQTIAMGDGAGGSVANALAPYLEGKLVPIVPAKGGKSPQLVLNIESFEQSKKVSSFGIAGQIQSYRLDTKVVFSVRNEEGDYLLEDESVRQTREMSYNETIALAKGTEESVLNQDMLNEIALVISHRLESIKLADLTQ